jgi:hypothetical protein
MLFEIKDRPMDNVQNCDSYIIRLCLKKKEDTKIQDRNLTVLKNRALKENIWT